MNTTGFKSIVLVIFLGFTFASSSCQRRGEAGCPDPITYTDSIRIENRLKIPYNGFDALTFVNRNTGDTHTFVGIGIVDFYTKTDIYNTSYECMNFALIERVNYKFVSSTLSEPLNLYLFQLSYQNGPFIQVNFKGQLFWDGMASVRAPWDIDEKKIGDSTYYDIEYLSDFNFPGDTSFYAAYNIQYGILQLKFKNGELWELLGKK